MIIKEREGRGRQEGERARERTWEGEEERDIEGRIGRIGM